MQTLRSKLEQSLGWIVLLLLLIGCLAVLRPFISALLWAVVLCVSSWPVYRRLLRWFGHRRTLAALVMTLGMMLIGLLPIVVVGTTLAENVKALSAAAQKWVDAGPPAPPAWLAKVPVVGAKAVESWTDMAGDTGALQEKMKEWIQPVSAGLLRGGLVLGRGLLELALSIGIAFFLFRDGAAIGERLKNTVERIAGEKGQHLLTIAGKTIRGVVYGILGTSLVQAVLAGIGYFIAGVPGAALLALLTFFLSVVPVFGTGLVWLPASIWLFYQGATGWGIFMLIWGLIVGNLDSVIRPLFISQGSDMPFILIFFGIIGGALAFGFIGLFLGPTLLAVGFRLVQDWSAAHRVLPDDNPAGKTP